MRYSVVVTDRVSKKGLAPLREDERFDVARIDPPEGEKFESALAGAHGLIVRSATRVDAAMIARAGHLRVIGRAGAGLDNIDLAEASRRGIGVFNAPGAITIAAAELTVALMLSLARRVTEADRSIRSGEWDRVRLRGVELRGRTVGLVGVGRVGSEVAGRCQAFGMEVIAHDPYVPAADVADLGVRLVDLPELLSTADIVSLHVPLTEETRRLIDGPALRAMKKQAFLINSSRGAVVDEEALVKALHKKRIAGAALDVFETEPLPAESPLRTAPNVVLTPHLGASTKEAQLGVAHEVATTIRDVLLDGDLSGAVNASRLVG